jgi:hypothetical protein
MRDTRYRRYAAAGQIIKLSFTFLSEKHETMIFKQISTAVLVGFALTMTACAEKETETAADANEAEAILTHTSPATPGATTVQPATVISAQPGQVQPATKVSAQAAKTAAGMNPAHGEPGHRCDIAVGAPLSTPPTGKTAMPVQMTQNPSTQTMTATPVQAKPASAPASSGNTKLNPAHGQPGHDCKVPVGAPLGS